MQDGEEGRPLSLARGKDWKRTNLPAAAAAVAGEHHGFVQQTVCNRLGPIYDHFVNGYCDWGSAATGWKHNQLDASIAVIANGMVAHRQSFFQPHS